MSLDLRKLAKVKPQGDGRIIARCPACAAVGQDEDGNHLVIYSDGRFGCVVYPGEDGRHHRKIIWASAGDGKERRSPPIIKFTVKTK